MAHPGRSKGVQGDCCRYTEPAENPGGRSLGVGMRRCCCVVWWMGLVVEGSSVRGQVRVLSAPWRFAVQGLAHGQRAPLEFFTFGERHRRKAAIFHTDWAW